MKDLNEIHKLLRKARYFYYELGEPESIISDYEYDMLEKKYDKLCNDFNIPYDKRVTSYVGFNIAIPMSLCT